MFLLFFHVKMFIVSAMDVWTLSSDDNNLLRTILQFHLNCDS
jgi:hypothetical protein